MFGLSLFGEGERKQDDEAQREDSVVRHRRNGSPYVNPNELVDKAGTSAILGDVSESIDELQDGEDD